MTADGGRLRVPAAAPEEKWHVMHAYKSERLAEEMLSRAGGLEHFVPKRCAMRVFHGRKRPCLVPVIPGLVFVRSTRVRIVSFKQEVYNGLQFVMGGDRGCRECLVVPDSDMDSFIKVCSLRCGDARFFRPGDARIGRGARVRVHGGPFDGVEGVFVRCAGGRSRRLAVILAGVLAVSVTVDPDYLEILR